MTDHEADQIAAFLARKGATVCAPAPAYGVDKEADRAARAKARGERDAEAMEREAERYAEDVREAYHAGGTRARNEVMDRRRY